MGTHQVELLVKITQLRVHLRVRLPFHEDLVPPLDPALRRRLAEVDLLGLVSAGKGIEIAPKGLLSVLGLVVWFLAEEKKRREGYTLPQHGLFLLGRPPGRFRHVGVGARVENLLPMDHALAHGGPALGEVVFRVLGVDGGARDDELELVKVAEKLGDSRPAVFVD